MPRRKRLSRLVTLTNCGPKLSANRVDFVRILVLSTRPEEPLQAVAFTPRHNMHVKMGDALADTIIGCNEGSFCSHTLLDGPSEHTSCGKKWSDQRIGNIHEGLKMGFGNQQAVSRKQRAMIEEGERVFVFKNPVAVRLGQKNLTEGTVFSKSMLQVHEVLG